MVYVKTGYKTQTKGKRRTYYKRYNSPLKKSYIFSKKSAKSQAKQIYALKKKVNNLAYHIKPEIITQDCVLYNRIFTTDGEYSSPGVPEWHENMMLYRDNLFADNKCGYVMRGNKLRPYNFTIYGSFNNKNFTYVMNSGTANAASLDCPLTGYLRIIVCRLTAQQNNLPIQITKPIDTTLTNDFGLINGPLIDNVSSTFKIVKNKVIKIDSKSPQKMFKITVKNPGIVSEGATGIGPSIIYKNDYMIYLQYWCPDILMDGQRQVAPKQSVKMAVKFAFVDEN